MSLPEERTVAGSNPTNVTSCFYNVDKEKTGPKKNSDPRETQSTEKPRPERNPEQKRRADQRKTATQVKPRPKRRLEKKE